ncbi:hypothetical protein CORMATOL_00279 [Corynebacterium matruchotii ATCC 33806]|uniref:Uncharacterized protein n=1 Tax=Corynebacterium matruchotii ATCC 33806 TaxID=566549 RepID=C0DZY3_9CORY|nr:hypothetical protein CORMATOL_00279 [Corynebacterium matruchotii ATCC 33806]
MLVSAEHICPALSSEYRHWQQRSAIMAVYYVQPLFRKPGGCCCNPRKYLHISFCSTHWEG